MVLGFEVPPVVPTIYGGDSIAMVLWFKHAASKQFGPPLTSLKIKQLVENNPDQVHSAIILDIYLANTDRAFGSSRRNVAFDEEERLVLFDFGNALFYRNREHAGIRAGIDRLDAVESDLANMFDKQSENPSDWYFQLLTDWNLVEKWCNRISQIPDFTIEAAISRIPKAIVPPDSQERIRLESFLKKRRNYLFEHIKKNLQLFPGLSGSHS